MRLAPSCPVCLRLDTLVSTPNLNSAHRHRETGMGMEGSEREEGKLKERSLELRVCGGVGGMSEKIEIGKKRRE